MGISCFPLESPKLGTRIPTKRAKCESKDSSLNRTEALFEIEHTPRIEQMTASTMIGYLQKVGQYIVHKENEARMLNQRMEELETSQGESSRHEEDIKMLLQKLEEAEMAKKKAVKKQVESRRSLKTFSDWTLALQDFVET